MQSHCNPNPPLQGIRALLSVYAHARRGLHGTGNSNSNAATFAPLREWAILALRAAVAGGADTAAAEEMARLQGMRREELAAALQGKMGR